MVAKATKAMAPRREQGNSDDLAGCVEVMFMTVPLVRNLYFDFKPGADSTPIPPIGTRSTLNTITPPWVPTLTPSGMNTYAKPGGRGPARRAMKRVRPEEHRDEGPLFPPNQGASIPSSIDGQGFSPPCLRR
jgi:hypothetical protein